MNDMRSFMDIITEDIMGPETPSAEQLAQKHKVSIEQVNAQIKKGTKIEFEHTDDQATANEIARDHIAEKVDYYDRLEKVEEAGKFDHVAAGSERHENAGTYNPNEQYSDAIEMRTIDGQTIVLDMTTGFGENLKENTPSLGIFVDKTSLKRTAKQGGAIIELTWDEARVLADKINDIANLAEHG